MTRHINITTLGRTAACLAAVGVLAACSSSSSSSSSAASGSTATATSTGSASGSLVNLSIAGSAGGGVLPASVAVQEGFFKQNGLNVTITYATNPTNLTEGLGHQYQIVESYQPTLISAVAQGIPAVGVAGGEIDTASDPITEAAVPASSSITSFADLAGKRIGTPTTNGAIAVCNLAAIDKAGGKPTSVTLTEVPFADQPAQADAGRIDAFFTATPYQATLAPKFRAIGDCFRSIDQDMFTIWISSQPWAGENAKVLSEFRTSLTEAADWIQKNHAGAIELFSKESGIDASLLNKAPIPAYESTLTENDVVPWIAMMKEVGMFSGTISNPDSLVLG